MALVKMDTRVQAAMPLHVVFASETLLALRTLVWLLTCSVVSRMNSEAPIACICRFAQRTTGILLDGLNADFFDGMVCVAGLEGAGYSTSCARSRSSVKITRGLKLRTYSG